jgi:ribonuclease VapC
MFIDASALVAMLAREEDAPELFSRLEKSGTRLTSPLAIWEASVALARILDRSVKDAEGEVNGLLALMKIETLAVPASASRGALDAFERYGKGRHKAGLNFGDCFAYACARHLRVPLLCKGSDFALTDIELA